MTRALAASRPAITSSRGSEQSHVAGFRTADHRALMWLALWPAVVALQWFYGQRSLLLCLLLLALACVWTFVVAVIAHNTAHVPMFESARLNRLLRLWLTLSYGHPVSAFVPGHNLSHHRFIESARDAIRTSKVRFRWNLLNLLLFFPTISAAVMRDEWRYVQAARRQDRAWFREFALEAAVLIAVSAVLLLVSWKKFLLCCVLPGAYGAWGILTMNILQHDGCDPGSAHHHSRSFTGRAVNWLTFNNGFHAVHHEEPGLHWSELPKRHAELIAPHVHPGLVEPSLVRYVVRTYIWPGKRLRYDGVPFTPEHPGADENWIQALPGSSTRGRSQ